MGFGRLRFRRSFGQVKAQFRGARPKFYPLFTGLLDTYAGASAAYSLRRLSQIASSVVRVRRASDNAEKDFTADDITDSSMVNWVNGQIVPPLDIRELDSNGERTGALVPAAAAYSLRNLSASYTGNVVDVRRSSDNAEDSFTAAEVADGTLTDWVNEDGANLIGNARYFNGTSSSVNLASLITLSGDFTMSWKAIQGVASAIEGYFGYSVGATDFISRTAAGGLYLKINNVAKFFSGGIASVPAGLNSFTLSRTSGVISGTINGVSTGTITNSDDIIFNRIGRGTQFGNYLDGSIYDINIDNSVAYTGLGTSVTAWEDTIGSNDGTEVNGATYTGQGLDGFVTQWYDQSGNANHATQGTDASQPKIVDAGSLVSGGLDFDGVDDFFDAPFPLDGATAHTSIVVASPTKASRILSIKEDGRADENWRMFISGSNNTGYGLDDGTAYAAQTAITLGNRALVFGSYDASDLKISLNGGTPVTSSVSGFTLNTTGDLEIGRNAYSGGNAFGGKIEELIIYNSDQSDNRTAIEANIGETYNIDLPSGVDTGYDQVDGFVETWYDQSGNGNDAVQQVSGSQPKIVDAGVLVSGGLEFDGSDDFFETSLVPPNVATLIGVANWDVEDQTQMILGARDSTNQRSYLSQTSSGKSALGVAASALTDVDIVAGDDYLLFGVYSGATRLLSTNGSVVSDSSGSAPNNNTYGYNIGSINTAGVISAYMDGTLAEIIVYNSDQSANREAIETNINNQYDIY